MAEEERVRIRVSLYPNDNRDRALIEHLQQFDNQGVALKELACEGLEGRMEPGQEETKHGEMEPIRYKIIRREKQQIGNAPKGWFGRKKKKAEDTVELIRYQAEEAEMTDFQSLEEYVIGKNLDSNVMAVITAALNEGVSYGTILSMVENGLNAHQMRSVIDLIRAKEERDKQSAVESKNSLK